MADPGLLSDVIDKVAVITLNRPHRHNAVNDELSAQIHAAVDGHLRDPEVRCVLLCGEGPSFCSGRDTAELGRRTDGQDDFTFVREHQRLRLQMLESAKPIVAAVQGAVLGGGFELALAADIRIIADDAVFGLPEVEFGLVPDTGGTQVLPVLIGPARAKYLVLSGARIDAATAYAWGLGEEIVPRHQLRGRAMQLCRELASRPELAVSMGKMLVNQGTAGAVRRGIGQELLAQTALFNSPDYQRIRHARDAGADRRRR